MSVENLKEYARRCATDPELLAKAKAFGLMDMEEHMRQAGSLGLDWTMDDMVALRKEVIDTEGDIGDLGEEELEQIAGGIVTAVAAVVVGGVAAGVAAGSVSAAAAAGGTAAAGDGGW